MELFVVVIWNLVPGTWNLGPGPTKGSRKLKTLPDSENHTHCFRFKIMSTIVQYTYIILILPLAVFQNMLRINHLESSGLQHQISEIKDLGFSIKDQRIKDRGSKTWALESEIGTSK